jgi:hypothetical protein
MSPRLAYIPRRYWRDFLRPALGNSSSYPSVRSRDVESTSLIEEEATDGERSNSTTHVNFEDTLRCWNEAEDSMEKLGSTMKLTSYASIPIDALTTTQRGFGLNCLSLSRHELFNEPHTRWKSSKIFSGRLAILAMADIHPAPTSPKLNLPQCSASLLFSAIEIVGIRLENMWLFCLPQGRLGNGLYSQTKGLTAVKPHARFRRGTYIGRS